MISGIIIFLIVALFIFLGVRRGAARSLLMLAASAGAAVLAYWLAPWLARAIYDNSIHDTVLRNLEKLLSEHGADYAARHSMEALPDGARGLAGFFCGIFGASSSDVQGRLVISSDHTEQAAQAMEKPLGDLITVLISALLMVVLFTVFAIALRLLARVVLGFFEIPVIRQLNHILGGVLGALEGLLAVFLLANLLCLLISYSNPQLMENKTVFGGVFNALLLFR